MKAVNGLHPLDIDNWYERKFRIDDDRVATAGSCFAQHIGRRLRASGFNFVDTEPKPHHMSEEASPEFGYRMYSARFGNVYSARQLLQLIRRAKGKMPGLEEEPWQAKGGFVDPFRPTIEPPIETREEVRLSSRLHLASVNRMFRQCNTFIFTLGLTEAWVNKATGAAYPVCPGVSGGRFDPQLYEFVNFGFEDVLRDMLEFLDEYRELSPNGKLILTVSPVPLVATASGNNVVVATSYSKAVLRAVAGDLSSRFDYVDYFPSFEIIASTPMRGMFFNADQRSVNEFGVTHVMTQFFKAHSPRNATGKPAEAGPEGREPDSATVRAGVICDEMLLEMGGPN